MESANGLPRCPSSLAASLVGTRTPRRWSKCAAQSEKHLEELSDADQPIPKETLSAQREFVIAVDPLLKPAGVLSGESWSVSRSRGRSVSEGFSWFGTSE